MPSQDLMGKNGAKSLLHNAIMSKYKSGDAFICFNLKDTRNFFKGQNSLLVSWYPSDPLKPIQHSDLMISSM